MANLQNRTRVVYVRVSEDEFQQFRDLCHQQGARNMSDLVRSAMELMVRQHKDGFESEVTARLRQLEASVNDLNRTMAQIAVERPA
jgi:hypothetical protein